VASALAALKVEALLVSSPASIRYLTGYAGSNGLLFMTPGESHFFTDPRYATDARENIGGKIHISKKPLIDDAGSVIKRKHLRRVGYEPGWMQVETFERLKKSVGSGPKLVPVAGFVEGLRAIKSPSEIDLIRESVNVNSKAFEKTLRRVKPKVRELEVAAELDYQMRMAGAENTAFETIVASGARSALPHARPTDRQVEAGEFLLVDMGALRHGYCSDMTRMAFTGPVSKKARDLYKAVLEAQLAAIDVVRAGVPVKKVDVAARDVLKKHGLDKAFVHSTGHGLGLEIHEAPRIAKKDKSKLQSGMTITIEPGAYIEGFGGVRIEDTVLVTESGCEVLTPTSKELVELA
jgi:Xaa-Pro aminopeptidase